jgi:hypothetical protein
MFRVIEPKVGCTGFVNHNLKALEGLTKKNNIKCDLLAKFSLDTSFNKLITNHRQIMLINCECKFVRETLENISAHKA